MPYLLIASGLVSSSTQINNIEERSTYQDMTSKLHWLLDSLNLMGQKSWH